LIIEQERRNKVVRKKKYGVVLVGTGATSKRHLEAIVTLGHRLIGVVDLIPERAKEKKEEFKAETWATDYHTLLKRKDVDIVVITTWPSTHSRIAIDSMRAGKDIICEKPMADTLKKAKEMVEVARETKRKIIFGYILRYNKSYQTIARMVQKGKIGSPLIMRIGGAEHTVSQAHWEQDQTLLRDTSPLIDCGCHYVDLMRWFTGEEAVRVSGIGARVEKETPRDKYDWGKMLVQLNKGSVGFYEVGWGHNFRAYNEKEFIGPRGRIRLTYAYERGEEKEKGDLLEYYSYPDQHEFINIKGDIKQTAVQFQDLIEHIEKDGDCTPLLENAYKSLEIVLAGDKAIKKGKVMHL